MSEPETENTQIIERGPLQRVHLVRVPAPLTPMVGRRRQLARTVQTMRAREQRLVTCVGAPGVGKTRFAIEAFQQLTADFGDGELFVDCSEMTAEDDLLQELARQLCCASRLDAIVAKLEHRHVLILFDSFDVLAPGATLLVGMLRSCPQVGALVTSRSPLQVRGEWVVDIPPLTVPARTFQGAGWLDDLANNPTVQVFLQRARSVSAPITVNEQTADDIVDVCRFLDGLPLAIELVAQRVRLFPLGALRSRLNNPLPLLTGGAADLPPRLRSMTNAVLWSYDRLDPAEQDVFRRLSIFTGSFSLELVEQLLLPSQMEASQKTIEQSIEILSLCGLVIPTLNHESEARFRMLRPIRAVGQQLLQETGEGPGIYRRLLALHAARLRNAAPSLVYPGEGTRNVEDRGNGFMLLQTALQFGGEAIADGLQIVEDVWPHWGSESTIATGMDLLKQLLDRSTNVPIALRSMGQRALAMLLVQRDQMDKAERAANISLEFARMSRSPRELAASLHVNGYLEVLNDDLDTAMTWLEEGIDLASRHSLADVESAIALSIGDVAMTRGQWADAALSFERVYQLGVQTHDKAGAAWAAYNLMRVAMAANDSRRARRWYEIGMELASSEQKDLLVGELKVSMAVLELSLGNFDISRRLVEDAITQFLVADPRRISRESIQSLAEYLRRIGDFRGAMMSIGASGRHIPTARNDGSKPITIANDSG